MLGNCVLLSEIRLCEFEKMRLGQQTEWKHKKVLKIHTSHLTLPSPLSFPLKLFTLICLGSFLLEFSSTFMPASRNHRATKHYRMCLILHMLKFLDQNRGFAHALELQLCLSSFLNTDRLKHFFKRFLPLGLKSSLFREDLSELETKDLTCADLSLLKPTGP